MKTLTIPNSIFQRTAFFYLLIFFFTILSTTAVGADRPFNNAANWGGTGLMEIPNARILEDGVLRVGYAQASPYRWYAGGMGVFPGFEFSGRFTEMTSFPKLTGNFSGYGYPKDKAFDLKYQILPESKRFPAIAVGIHDFHGTRLFPAKYLVLSRQIFPFDFTMGLGSERLKGPLSIPLRDEFGLWGGIEWAMNERLNLLAEYNPIEYEKDLKRAVPQGAKSQVNVGLRMKLAPGLDIGISYQRGDTLGLMCHLQFEIGKPIRPKRSDPPKWGTIDRRNFSQRDVQEMVDTIRQAVEKAGFQDVLVYTDSKELTAEFENKKYLSNQKAAGRVLRILLYNSPSDTQKLTVVLKRRQMSFLKVSVKPDHLDKYLFGKIPEDIFYELIQVEAVADTSPARSQNIISSAAKKSFDYRFGVKPDIATYLNDPSGVFKYRLGIKPYVSSTFWKGGEAYARYDIPFYSNISSSNDPPPDVARADSWKYSGRDYSIERLMFDQALRLSKKTFGRLSAGYFERMYAGAGGEVLTFWGDGHLALGVEGDWVRKREPGTQLGLLDFKKHTLLGNFYCFLPPINATLQAQYGRFLGGDIGWRFQVGREYASGAVMGAWYSFTDTDDFKESYNRDYRDKGVFISIPARMFTNFETSTRYNYSLSPWTRDVAATVAHWKNLFSLGSDLMPARFKSDMGSMAE